jgi:hypothetical protein
MHLIVVPDISYLHVPVDFPLVNGPKYSIKIKIYFLIYFVYL